MRKTLPQNGRDWPCPSRRKERTAREGKSKMRLAESSNVRFWQKEIGRKEIVSFVEVSCTEKRICELPSFQALLSSMEYTP